MNIYRFLKTGALGLLLFFGTATIALGVEQIPSVSNTITNASINDAKQLTISGTLERELFYEGQVYAIVNYNGSDYSPIDQVVSADTFAIAPGNNGINYTINFNLNAIPSGQDQMVMVWRDENATPLDIDPIFFDSDTVLATESMATNYAIEKCRFDNNLQLIFCSSQGSVPEQLTVEWYTDSVYNGKIISTDTIDVVSDGETSFSLETNALPAKDGLYPYVIRDLDGRHVYQGSSRIGQVRIPELEDKTQPSVLDGVDTNFAIQIAALVFGFMALAFAAGVLLMGNTKMRFVYAAALLVIVGLLGYWYQAQAAVYESTDYRQFRYSVSINPIADDQYWISYGAIDTYTSTPPDVQQVQFTVDGVNYTDLIDDNSGRWSHTRQVTISDADQATAAIRIVDGCASYYGFTSFDGASRYGTFDCEPVALFPSEESIVGCMNPEARNYDPNARIESGDCQFGGCTNPTALNYNADATIDDGSCVISGCTNPTAANYDSNANTDDGSCICPDGGCDEVYGCMSPSSINYNADATVDDGSCICEGGVCPDVRGCTDSGAYNYNPRANVDDGTCRFCTTGTCPNEGCTDIRADNYNPRAVVDDGSCYYDRGDAGCMNPAADNYNPRATTDDGSCICTAGTCVAVYGCTNSAAPNYDAAATVDDGSCRACYWTPTIPNPTTYCTFESYTQTSSCTGATRTVPGTQRAGWFPDLTAADVCSGNSIAQTQVCSGTIPAPRRVINGTGTGAFCVRPDADFLISTNLVNWTTCDTIDRLRIVRPNQPIYIRSTGVATIDTWSVSQALGEITGVVTNHEDEVYKINFSYPVEKKNYEDIIVSGTSFAGNTAQQTCDLTLLNFNVKEI